MTLKDEIILKMIGPGTVGEAADAIITLFTEMVENEKNPYFKHLKYVAVEKFRQAILKRVKE